MAEPAIVVVDDEPDLREAVAEYLARRGFDVRRAGDAVELRRHLAERQADLVVLDISMPGEDGLSVARGLRAETDIGIIMLSAAGDVVDRVVGLEVGADDYMTKPFHKDELIARRVREIKQGGGVAAVSAAPHTAERAARAAVEAGADLFFVQSTVGAVRFESSAAPVFPVADFCRNAPIPVVVGNTVGYQATLELMEAGAAGVLVGVGPGHICTSRKVLGIGVPQITATADCAAARDEYHARTGRYVPVITDGGMKTGGDIAKAIAAGADAVMLGSTIAAAAEAPAPGYSWGMATSSADLPRGTRIKVGVSGTLGEILFGPAHRDDGTMNLIGALRLSMGSLGARNLREMQRVEMMIAPSLPTEGKSLQRAQGVG